jgi:hypothetical protein
VCAGGHQLHSPHASVSLSWIQTQSGMLPVEAMVQRGPAKGCQWHGARRWHGGGSGYRLFLFP